MFCGGEFYLLLIDYIYYLLLTILPFHRPTPRMVSLPITGEGWGEGLPYFLAFEAVPNCDLTHRKPTKERPTF